MDHPKIKTLNEIVEISKRAQKENNAVALVHGCFDILHIGHIMLFREAKKKADILIVAIDNDENVTKSKGPSRPYNSLDKRLLLLAELSIVDFAMPIEDIIHFESVKADKVYSDYLSKIMPNYYVTNSNADVYWSKKKERADLHNIKFIDTKANCTESSSKIAQKIESEV